MTSGLRAMGVAVAMLVAALPLTSQALSKTPLRGLEPGEWELRERPEAGAKGDVRRICLTDIRQLVQLRHGHSSCKRLTVDEAAKRLVVSYECGSAGTGRTDLRIETARLVQIQSQGIAGGAPFSFSMEGRRVGACH
ncbi:MAG TPA: DUF3617 family protein [Sphingobium sp.]|nr:DUF3617 family protein [Sphingobium sp.]